MESISLIIKTLVAAMGMTGELSPTENHNSTEELTQLADKAIEVKVASARPVTICIHN